MAVRMFPGRGGQPTSANRFRMATAIVAGCRGRRPNLLPRGALNVTQGTASLEVVGFRTGGQYNLAAGEWSWCSYDGICAAVNETAITGAGLTDSGNGEGTTISKVMNTGGLLTDVWSTDTDL